MKKSQPPVLPHLSNHVQVNVLTSVERPAKIETSDPLSLVTFLPFMKLKSSVRLNVQIKYLTEYRRKEKNYINVIKFDT